MEPSVSLKAAALRMLAQREQSVTELRRKLLKQALAQAGEGPDAADGADAQAAAARVEQLVAWLLENKYLSEERFTESRVHLRSARFGNLRIRHELGQHGIQLAPSMAAELALSEAQRALAVWQRKYGEPPADARERARQMRFLANRGFSPAVIAQLMRRCKSGSEDSA